MESLAYGWTEAEYAWRSQAACEGYADLFFPQQDLTHVRAAVAICRTCPVVRECGEYADSRDERNGVWGGRNRAARVRVSGPQS